MKIYSATYQMKGIQKCRQKISSTYLVNSACKIRCKIDNF